MMPIADTPRSPPSLPPARARAHDIAAQRLCVRYRVSWHPLADRRSICIATQVATIGHKDVLRILELSRQFFGEDGQGRHALSAEASEYVVRQLKSAIDRINGCGGSAGAKAALAAVKLIAGAGKVSVINPKTGAVSVIDSDVPDDPRDEPSLGWLIGRTIRRSPPEGEVGDDIEVVIEAQAPPAYEEVAAAMGSVTVPVNKLVARCNIKRTAPLELVRSKPAILIKAY
eukprot:COSAG05_NODE_264_length_12674_cov_6.768111_12_plen_229_part_00